MARCEVCGFDQFPANTIVELDAERTKHFFCSFAHMREWRDKFLKQICLEEVLAGMEQSKEVVEEEPEAAPKRRGRPPGSKNKS